MLVHTCLFALCFIYLFFLYSVMLPVVHTLVLLHDGIISYELEGFRRKWFWPTLRLCPVENRKNVSHYRFRRESETKCLTNVGWKCHCLSSLVLCDGEETLPTNYYIV